MRCWFSSQPVELLDQLGADSLVGGLIMPLDEEYAADITYLKRGLKWSLKREILTVFSHYSCSNDFHVSTPYYM